MFVLPCTVYDYLELQPYQAVWQSMHAFSQQATAEDGDQLWLMEHEAVFTQGKAGKAEHILNTHNVPIVQTDRGGQVTYHGPGQLMIYPLLNVERLQLNSRDLVRRLENTVIACLADFGITAQNNPEAPGVYTNDAKIASIGLRITRGRCYHGMALNVDMDLTPFQWINPCGFQNQAMTMISEHSPGTTMANVKMRFLEHFSNQFKLELSPIRTE